MYFSFNNQQISKLTEVTSLNLVKQIQSQAIKTPLQGKSIETTFVRQGKRNPPLLLLHGFDSSLLEFRRLLPELSENYQVWAVDLLGFGFTQRYLDLTYNPEAIKIHLYHFWQTLIREPVILVGASMGGATALDFTLTYPHAIEKLILIDSGGLTRQPIMGKFMFPPLDFLATEFLRNLRVRQAISRSAYYEPSFASEDALNCAALHLSCEGWNRALISFTKSGGYGDFSLRLGEIARPTLIIWGENDQILGTKPANQFERLIGGSNLVWIEKCGHVPHLEKSQIVANHILEFTNT